MNTMGSNILKDYEALLENVGCKVNLKYREYDIINAEISVYKGRIYICNNHYHFAGANCPDLHGYKHSYLLTHTWHEGDQNIKEIRLSRLTNDF